MSPELTFGLLCLTSFFTLINPLGVMPIFLSMTQGLSAEERRRTARKASIVALITVLFFAFAGQLLFRLFGISVNGLKIVGGIIFLRIGMDMLQARLTPEKKEPEDVDGYVNDIAITPLAIPMMCGPGAITNAIVLMQDAPSTTHRVILVASVALVLLIMYFALIGSARIMDLIGKNGNRVLMKVMGLIVMVIAVEFFLSGLKPVVMSWR